MESKNEREVERMSLRALMKRREIDSLNAKLEELREKAKGHEEREAEIAQMIEDAETDEERTAVEEEITSFEQEKEETASEIADIEEKVRGIEAELSEIEEHQELEPKPETNERGLTIMNKRNVFRSMEMQTREAIFEREEVRSFLGEVRSMLKGEKRAITNGGLLVPEVFIGLIRQNIEEYSKLYKHVNVRQIGGNGKVVVMGTIPEAVWTQCCANINELDLVFNDAEVDCWKVGGYFDVCNATIEDSDVDLASEIVTVLGQAIGYALDKAIVFGLGTRMPQGFFTRLAQTAQPESYPSTARTWINLSSTNVKTIANTYTGASLIQQIVLAAGNAKGKYSRGEKVWIMNETTYTKLAAATVTTTADGQIVTGIFDRMPVVGGIIEVLDFVPDNMIFGGYLDLYLLGERSGTTLAQSEHAKFIEDRTVFKGTARYDGLPVIAEGFVAIGIDGTAPAATGITFEPDNANTVQAVVLNKAAVSVATGDTVRIYANTLPVSGPITWASSAEGKATVDANGVVTGVTTGTATITAASGAAQASCVVTVTT